MSTIGERDIRSVNIDRTSICLCEVSSFFPSRALWQYFHCLIQSERRSLSEDKFRVLDESVLFRIAKKFSSFDSKSNEKENLCLKRLNSIRCQTFHRSTNFSQLPLIESDTGRVLPSMLKREKDPTSFLNSEILIEEILQKTNLINHLKTMNFFFVIVVSSLCENFTLLPMIS